MDSTALPWINLLIGSGGIVGVCIVIFRFGKLVQKIDSMNDKMDNGFLSVDKRLEKIDSKLDALEKGQSDLRVQLGKLETRVEERTLRVVHTTKEIRPDPAHFGSLNIQEEKTTRNTPSAVS